MCGSSALDAYGSGGSSKAIWFTSWLVSVSTLGYLYKSWNQLRSAQLPEPAPRRFRFPELERAFRLQASARDEEWDRVGRMRLDGAGRGVVGGDRDHVVGQPE